MHRPSLVSLLFLVAASACELPDDHEELDSSDQPLLGSVGYASDCTGGQKNLLDDFMRYGRVVAASKAFEQCIDRAVRVGYAGIGPYRRCPKDPFASAWVGEQIERVIAVARSPNRVGMQCTGGGGNASVDDLGTYGHSLDEYLKWGEWLTGVVNDLSSPVCAPGASGPGCRFAAAPWPFNQGADSIWHEAMHTHGYDHGANNQPAAKIACGYGSTPDSYWHYQRNTMPYIVGNCVAKVVDLSASVCGGLETCGEGGVLVVDGLDRTTCTCRQDPGPKGVGAVSVSKDATTSRVTEGASIDSLDISVPDYTLTSWDQPVAAADFLAKGHDQVVLKGPWGLAIVDMSAGDPGVDANYAWGKVLPGGWTLQSSDVIVGTGNYDGIGGKDLLIRNGSRIAVLRWGYPRTLQVAASASYGTFTGGWLLGAADQVLHTGDFDRSGKDDFIVRSGWGMGLLTINGSGFGSLNVVANGTALAGGWVLGSGDQFLDAGDFDKDYKPDIVVRSGWGLGVLTRTAAGSLTTIDSVPHGTWVGGWLFGSADRYRGMGDFDGDERQDLVFTSGWGLGIWNRKATGGFDSHQRFARGTMLEGGWQIGDDAITVDKRDLDGDHRADMVVSNGSNVGVLGVNFFLGLRTSAKLAPGGVMAGFVVEPDGLRITADVDGDRTSELIMRR